MYPNSEYLFQMSVYNNKRKLFLKNMEHYTTQCGPSFYTIQNESLISEISQYFDTLKSESFCNVYQSEDVFRILQKNTDTMIDRMLSIE